MFQFKKKKIKPQIRPIVRVEHSARAGFFVHSVKIMKLWCFGLVFFHTVPLKGHALGTLRNRVVHFYRARHTQLRVRGRTVKSPKP